MGCELFEGKGTGGDGHGFCADGSGAGYIVGSVSEYEDAFRREIDAMDFCGAVACEFSEFVSVVMVVGKGAELEEVMDPVVLEFEFSAALEVAGEKAEGDMGHGVEGFHEGADARQ